MKIEEIKTASPFCDLFPIAENISREILWDIQKHGFDESKPIVLWEGRSVIIDGHTRLRAATKAGLQDVPVVMKDFKDEDDALEYAVRCQRNRRNLTDREIIHCFSELDKRKTYAEAGTMKGKKPVPNGTGSGRSSKETAEILGISSRKVERTRAVLDKAPEEVKNAVKSGEMSINAAYNKTVKPQKGTSKSLELAAGEIEKIDKVFEIIKERLTKKQIKELIRRLKKDL